MRKEQREATRQKIVAAALSSIAERGYDGLSTRHIASVAGISQGLLTYHFKTKDELWRAAAEYLFGLMDNFMETNLSLIDFKDTEQMQREPIRQFVNFNSKHPELARFMLQQGDKDDSRTEWLVDTYVKPAIETFKQTFPQIPKEKIPYMFYSIVGASGLIFCIPVEFEKAMGINPKSSAFVESYAEYLTNLFLGEG